MKIQQHQFKINRTASYAVLGDAVNSNTLWFVLHGYGMLAQYFIKKFEPILNETTCIIAPEGLSKFYVDGFYGRVGASWMTKEGRESEIEDYVGYLDQLYEHVVSRNKTKNLKINVLGFSQGGATVSRWVANKKIHYNNLILWASTFPDDIDFKTILPNANTFLLYGTEDEFASKEQINAQKDRLQKVEVDVQFIEFEGKHTIPANVITAKAEQYGW